MQEMQRKADAFARRQHQDAFKHFERLLKRSSKGQEGAPIGPWEDHWGLTKSAPVRYPRE
jgi:hypothetical protein